MFCVLKIFRVFVFKFRCHNNFFLSLFFIRKFLHNYLELRKLISTFFFYFHSPKYAQKKIEKKSKLVLHNCDGYCYRQQKFKFDFFLNYCSMMNLEGNAIVLETTDFYHTNWQTGFDWTFVVQHKDDGDLRFTNGQQQYLTIEEGNTLCHTCLESLQILTNS